MEDWAEEAAEQRNLVAQRESERQVWLLHAAQIIAKRGEFVFRQLYTDSQRKIDTFNNKLRPNSEDRLEYNPPMRGVFWVRRKCHPTVGVKVRLDAVGQFISFECARRANHECDEESKSAKFDLVVADTGQVCLYLKGEIIDPADAAEIILGPLMQPELMMSKWFLPLASN